MIINTPYKSNWYIIVRQSDVRFNEREITLTVISLLYYVVWGGVPMKQVAGIVIGLVALVAKELLEEALDY